MSINLLEKTLGEQKISKPITEEQIKAWFDSGPITEEILSLWLEIINGSKKQSP
jgi:hypothetical protein